MTGIDFEAARERMVDGQIRKRGISSESVLAAFSKVPRHLFVPENQHVYAYADSPLPIALGQTISQPYIAAYMTEALKLGGEEIVLEIGTGSGYQAAILSEIAAEVHTVERHPDLAKSAASLLSTLGYRNVYVHEGDGTLGLPALAPFDAVMVTAAAPGVPEPLLDQLRDGGCLIMPVGGRRGQILELHRRTGDRFSAEQLSPVAFVPLIGEKGWKKP